MKFAYNKRTKEIDAISDKIADKLKSEGKPVFNSEAEATDYLIKLQSRRSPEQIAAEGQQASDEMNIAIEKNKQAIGVGDDTWFERYQKSGNINEPIINNESIGKRIGRGIAETLMPATYESSVKGEQPGVKESSLDISRAGLFLIPGGAQARGLLPIAQTSAKTLLPKLATKSLNIGRTVLPTIGIETARGTAVEGIESIAEDRPYDWSEAGTNIALGAVGEGAAIAAQRGLKQGFKTASGGFDIDDVAEKLIETKNISTPAGFKNAVADIYEKTFGPNINLTPDLKDKIKENLAKSLKKSIESNSKIPPEVKKQRILEIIGAVDEIIDARQSFNSRSLAGGTDFQYSDKQLGTLIDRNLPEAINFSLTGEKGLLKGLTKTASQDAIVLPKISIPVPNTSLLKNATTSNLKYLQPALRFAEIYNLPSDEKPRLPPLQ